MLILAHRGFHATQPENTIGAFAAARLGGVPQLVLAAVMSGFAVYFLGYVTQALGQSGLLPTPLAAVAPALTSDVMSVAFARSCDENICVAPRSTSLTLNVTSLTSRMFAADGSACSEMRMPSPASMSHGFA